MACCRMKFTLQSLKVIVITELVKKLPDCTEHEISAVTSSQLQAVLQILYLWFRASLIYINNCPTRCNTKQSIYHSASSLYMFRVSTTPIIRSTQNCNHSVRYWPCCAKLACPRWRTVATPLPEAVVTVLSTPDDGCGWHLKHVEWTCRMINRLLCVASRWTVIDIDQRCTET